MPIRVSTRMFEDSYLQDLAVHQSRLYKLQQQSATGKRILSPSDDPLAAQQATLQQASLAANHQYQTNLSDAKMQVSHAYTVTRTVTDLVDQAQTLAEQGASDSITPDGRAALATQLNQLLEEAASQANDQTLGRYTYAGVHTGTAPYTVTRDAGGNITAVTATATSTTGDINRQVDAGTSLKVNLNGSDVFGGVGAAPGTIDYFATLVQLRDALKNNDANAVRALVPQLGQLHDQTQAMVTVTDARAQRLARIQGTLEQQDTDTQATISQLENVDIAKAALDLQSEQLVYQQALQVGSRILTLGLGTLQG